ncbi:retrotransposon protein, putative, ty1-copia subclass [Tanacetum coccineum]
MDGNVHTYKARLVAKGFTKTYGVNYEETFSPVADIRAIRILIAIIASIYGIKQASRQWNKRFDEQIKKFGFTQNCDESCVYVNASGREAAYILGIKIYRDSSRRLIDLCQSAYIEKILKILNMENSKRGSITMQKKLILSKAQGASAPAEVKRMQRVTYALDVRSIMYVVRCIRPDVAFAHNLTCQFQQNPGELHSLLYR